MHNNKALIDYWQQGLQQQALAAVVPTNVKNLWQVISSQECRNGKIDDPTVLESLLARGTSMVVAPIYAKQDADYFFPYLLLIELSANGKFSPNVNTAFPIIPRAVVEPAALSPISLGSFDNFESYLVMQPPEWLEDYSLLTWHNNLNYAEQLLEGVTNNVWRQHLQLAGFVIQDSALIFALSDIYKPASMDLKLLAKKQKVELIDAERNSGKSAYAKSLIIDAWMMSAIKQAPPPEYVWLNYDQQASYASIFELVTNENHSSKGIIELHQELVDNYNAFAKIKQIVHNWQQTVDKLQSKYADKGGIYARIAQLQDNLKEAHVHNRHLQVLHSIWLRQLELISNWTKVFDFVPFMQQQRLQRLYLFFKQNFSSEKVAGLNQKQLEEIILDKMRRAANSERFIADALHQTENDLRQEGLIRDKCLQWARAQDDKLINIETIMQLLDSAWDSLVKNTLDYWRATFASNRNYVEFLKQRPSKIDMLIVEHSEYVSPMQAAELLAMSERAVIMGNYNPICTPRFSVQSDYELTKNLGLANCDADFEDLQFDGALASLGNMWSLASSGKEADRVFTRQPEQQLYYEFKNIFAISEEHLGSRLNFAEVNGIFNWLSNNIDLIDQVAIYTTFSAQAQNISNRLKASLFASIPVRMLQEPCFNPKAISLFSPVYTANDPGPYTFDRGVEILDNLKANTTQRIVVIGDISIFKPELHSASGKFAKLLINKTKNQEVNCV